MARLDGRQGRHDGEDVARPVLAVHHLLLRLAGVRGRGPLAELEVLHADVAADGDVARVHEAVHGVGQQGLDAELAIAEQQADDLPAARLCEGDGLYVLDEEDGSGDGEARAH
ncbi:hypothetical protein VCV18_011888 [Metarhizium anisopliae]